MRVARTGTSALRHVFEHRFIGPFVLTLRAFEDEHVKYFFHRSVQVLDVFLGLALHANPLVLRF